MVARETLVELYEQMYKIRYYNERMQAEYESGSGEIPSGIHGSMGQEAPAAGICQHLDTDDWALSAHRSPHVALAKGMSLRELLAEQLGKEGGVCDGKAGEQHLLDAQAQFISGAIIAQQLPTATGLALAQQKKGTDNVVVAYMGEGAANQGGFYECLNLASVWNLPIVFVIEDNDWGISTPKERVTAVEDNSLRAAGQDMPGDRIEDNNVLSIYERAGEAIERARNGDGPTLLEIQTYRLMGHFFADPESYRSEDEFEQMRDRDCLTILESHLGASGVDEDELSRIEGCVEDAVDSAMEYAISQPPADTDIAVQDVFVDSTFTSDSLATAELPPDTVGASTYDRMSPAVVDGIREQMQVDESVFLMGEDIGEFGGVFDSTDGLYDEFGPERVRETPISETAFIGAGVGAALEGFRPVVELMYVDFAGVAFDQIYNEMAKVCYMSGGTHNVPMVLMTAVGMTPYQDPTHTQTLYGTFAHLPGMKVVVPSTPFDAKGLMTSAIADDNPVVYMFHKQLMLGMFDFAEGTWNTVPDQDYHIPIGNADIKREGSDITVATIGLHVHRALAAATQLADEGIDVEVLDLRTISPLDEESLIKSVQRTGRLLVVDEDYQSFGLSGELISHVSEQIPGSLDAVGRLTTPDAPVPYAPSLKESVIPNEDGIIAEIREMVD